MVDFGYHEVFKVFLDFLPRVFYLFLFQSISGPSFKYNIAEYKTTTADVLEFDSMALVDGEVTAHNNSCNTTSPSTGGELVTWTLDLQHEFYLHAMRIYYTGCSECGNELPSLNPCFIQYLTTRQKLQLFVFVWEEICFEL